MRILHVLDHSIPLHSGYTFRSRNILRGQRALGWHTAHVTGLKQGDCENMAEEIDGLRFYRTRSSNGPVSRLPMLDQTEVVRTLAKRIKEVAEVEKPDVLHAHSPALNGVATLSAGRALKLPVVYECRAFWEDAAVDHGTSREWGLRYRLTRALESRVFRKANAVTTICEGLREEITSRGIPAKKITVIPNAVDIDSFEFGAEPNAALKLKLGLAGKRVIGFIGSFYAYEGIPLLIRALPTLLSRHSDLRLLLVGGGPQEAEIIEEIERLGLQESVVLTGRIPHDTVQDYYNLVDVFVYPRLAMRLTDLVTPLKPLEAMAQGRLVVASDVGGHRELIENGVTGRLFEAGNQDALAATVSEVLDHQSEWPLLKENGRRFVELERNWAKSVDRYEPVYEALVGDC